MSSPKKNVTFIESVKYAWDGVRIAYSEERNLRSHVYSTIIIFILGYLFSFNIDDFLWLTLVCFIVIFSELLNTLVENIVDLVTDQYHPLAKKIKDIAAGTVLISSFFAVIMGIFLFLPKILSLF